MLRLTFKSVSCGGMSFSTVTNNAQSSTKMQPTLTLNISDAMLMPWNGSPACPETLQHSTTFLPTRQGGINPPTPLLPMLPWRIKNESTVTG